MPSHPSRDLSSDFALQRIAKIVANPPEKPAKTKTSLFVSYRVVPIREKRAAVARVPVESTVVQ